MVATVSFHEISTDCRIFVLSNALMKVSGCVPDIICIAQITRETINNTLSIHNWQLDFFGFKIFPQFLAHKNRLQYRENLIAEIEQLLPNRIRGYFEWKTNSYCTSIIGVPFYCACRCISKTKIIDGGINKAHEVVKTTENRAQFDTFCIKSLCGRR